MTIEDRDTFSVTRESLVEIFWNEGKEYYKFEATVKYESETSEKKLKRVFYIDAPEDLTIKELHRMIVEMAQKGAEEKKFF